MSVLSLPQFSKPANQEIVLVSAAYAVKVLAPDDTAVNLYQNGTLLGAMTLTAGVWGYSWTPSAVASNANLTAVGNVTGTGLALNCTVAEANGLNQTMSAWSVGGVSATIVAAGSGILDPDGGTNAYNWAAGSVTSGQILAYTSITGSLTDSFASSEIWVTPKNPGVAGAIDSIVFNNASNGAVLCVGARSGEGSASDGTAWIAEQRTVGGRIWSRVQWMPTKSTTTHNPIYHYITNNSQNNNAVFVVGDGMYCYHPRAVSTTHLAPSINQQMAMYFDSLQGTMGATNGYERYYFKHPWCDTVANMAGGPGGVEVRVVKPTGWTKTGNYPVVYWLKPIAPGGEAGEQLTYTMTVDQYANLYNCICVEPFERTQGYWWGKYDDGTHNVYDWLYQVLVPWVRANLGVSSLKIDTLFISYSKGGNHLASSSINYAPVVGVAGWWDAATDSVYPAANADLSYNTVTIYNQYDFQHMVAASPTILNVLKDGKHVISDGYYAWGPDQLNLKAVYDANSVPYDYRRVLGSMHSWGSSTSGNLWTQDLVARMFALRSAFIGQPPAFVWSEGILDASY